MLHQAFRTVNSCKASNELLLVGVRAIRQRRDRFRRRRRRGRTYRWEEAALGDAKMEGRGVTRESVQERRRGWVERDESPVLGGYKLTFVNIFVEGT